MSTTVREDHHGLDLPDTPLATSVLSFARAHLPSWVYGHSVRGYLFGRELARLDGLHPGRDYDDELVLVASALHDIGVSDAGRGPQRFEVEGADAAARFLRERGVSEERVATVWDAVALHTSEGIAHRKGTEVALTQLGVAADILGRDRDRLPPGFAERVHAVFPRHDVGHRLASVIVEQAAADPDKAGPLSFPGHLVGLQSPPGEAPTWFDLVEAAGWGDRSAYWEKRADVATAPEHLAALFSRFLAEGDPDALTGLYEPGATFVPSPGTVVKGTEAIREALHNYVNSGVRVDLRHRRIESATGLALMSHTATVTGLGSEARATTTAEIARRQADGRWLYVVDDPFFGSPGV